MATKNDTEQLRADFEAWCETRSMETGRDHEGDYISLETALSWEAYQAGRAALQSQATEAFPCRIVEADFETGTVTLEMHGKYTVSSGQKYLCDAPLQSQHGEETKNLRDALWIAERKIEDLQSQDQEDALTDAIRKAIKLLGPEAPICSGCEYEWNHALRVLREAIDHARRVEEAK